MRLDPEQHDFIMTVLLAIICVLALLNLIVN